MAIFCYWVNFHCCEWPNILNKQSSHQGCRNSSVNSSVPSKLLPRVQVPSTPSKLLSIYIDLCHMEKTKINKKRPGWPIFKTIQPSGHTACEYQTNSNLIKSFFVYFRGTKFSRFPNWLDNWLKMRKQLGLLMLFSAAVHVRKILFHLHTVAVDRYIEEDSLLLVFIYVFFCTQTSM